MKQTVDLVLFAGQSNMAGRGELKNAPALIPDAGFEFRAISEPTKLYPIAEPLGKKENNPDGIDDKNKKCGGLVPAFVNKYYTLTNRTIVAVSASEGGTGSDVWLKTLQFDAIARFQRAKEYLESNNFSIENTFMLWSQGETDGDHCMTQENYMGNLEVIFGNILNAGVKQIFLIQTGHFNYINFPENGLLTDAQYQVIRDAQKKITDSQEGVFKNVYLAGSFEPCLHLMKDAFHYHQEAYNLVGETAAKMAAGKIME